MNQQQKTDLDLDIMNLINKLIETPNDTKNAVLYIRGDAEFNLASLNTKGDLKLLAQTIQHFLQNNTDFRRFILAAIGSWLNGNPEEKEMFLNALELVKKTFSNN